VAQPKETPGEQPGPEDSFFARQLGPGHGLPAKIASVVLASRLRELRVQVGFTRLEPITANLQGEYDLKVRTATLSQTEKWLPANEIKGEGILLVLSEQAVAAVGEQRRQSRSREAVNCSKGYAEWASTVPGSPPSFQVRSVLSVALARRTYCSVSDLARMWLLGQRACASGSTVRPFRRRHADGGDSDLDRNTGFRGNAGRAW
jgi:hypothetical protein